ncbi:hypothetical protein niasHS_000407 [Heterodera schachtii]|uniref:Uncharacterized protein n=1 Tax=Heterodera schachtii TaxID=97005 RepID=A0ABD2KC90_HETSC
MLDTELTIQKAVQILVAHFAPRFAIIGDIRDGLWAMFTDTNCLRAHQSGDVDLDGRTLRHFFEHLHGGRQLISVDDQSSVRFARAFLARRRSVGRRGQKRFAGQTVRSVGRSTDA